MTKTVYVAAAEARVGKSLLSLGITEAWVAEGLRVAVYRPLVLTRDADKITENIIRIAHLDQLFESTVGVTYEEMAADQESAIATMITQMGALRASYDAIVVIGSDFSDVSTPIEATLNARIAANLDTPVLALISGRNKTPEQLLRAGHYTIDEFVRLHNHIIGVVASRVDATCIAEVKTELLELGEHLVGVLPEDALLSAPTVQMQFDAISASVVRGSADAFGQESLHVAVSGMTLPHLLARITDETTLIMASDRIDLLPGVLLSQKAKGMPKLSALVLVGGYKIPKQVRNIIDGLELDLPIATSPLDTYSVAQVLSEVEGFAMATPRKVRGIHLALQTHINLPEIMRRLDAPRRSLRTQHRFEYDIMEQARAQRRRVVLPESADARILSAAAIVLERNVADIVLLGEEDEVRCRATGLGLDISAAEIISLHDAQRVDRYATTMAEVRKHKGLTYEQAVVKLADSAYFGTMMVYCGDADAMVSGAAHTTANTIRPAFEIIKTSPDVKVVSGSYFMCMEDQVLMFADCAVNPNPTPEQLADIAIATATTAAAFGIEARIAMMSYSTGSSGVGPDVDMVADATALVRSRRPDLAVDGPLQFDAAIDPEVGEFKMPGSPVAGRATVFVFPDLQTGNIAYKAVQRTCGAVAVGPILQGLKKTVTDLSRGAMVDDIVSTIAITAVQAQAAGFPAMRRSAVS
ncbi:MAG: phosphate acetyltransferase [Propionibacteriaceae bacterium]|jgi:phosphate acetyltransferase|nr:phosphate acetyltransferase [Propionibacteriaceae bacterium]